MQKMVFVYLNCKNITFTVIIIHNKWGSEVFMAKKLLEQARDILRTKHYSYRTEKTYIDWMRRYILFHHKRHPGEMGVAEIQAFLTHLATERSVAASTQNQ